ncbi:MAG TPA: hypothetical protein VJP86_09220 [Vicinamibacterales bacterium]|jgi:hypothetical protein|nr:hypothetical protein [Vicinamibacterales bacterium]
MSKTLATTIASFALVGLIATTASAQTPPPFTQRVPPAGPTPAMTAGTTHVPSYELSAGYQILNVPDQTFPFGLNVDGAKNFGALGLVAEIGWALDKSSDETLGEDVTSQVWNFGAGPRYTARPANSSIWPFAQVIVGGAYLRNSVDVGSVSVTNSATKFMIQPGGGAVILAGDGWGIVGQVDYRRVFLDEAEDGDSGENDFRVFIGFRMILD